MTFFRNVSSDRQSCDFAYITKLTGNIPFTPFMGLCFVYAQKSIFQVLTRHYGPTNGPANGRTDGPKSEKWHFQQKSGRQTDRQTFCLERHLM